MPNSDPTSNPPSLLSRISLAFGAFFSLLGDAEFAQRYLAMRNPVAAPPPPPPPAPVKAPPPPPPPLVAARPDAALQLLGLLQRDGRLIDFVQEDLSSHSDADIGAAARLVHDGCGKVLREHFTIAPVRDEAEGSRIVLNEGFDAGAIKLTGNVVGKAPFRGSLSHRGWRATETRLPKLAESHDASVLAPAEVEL